MDYAVSASNTSSFDVLKSRIISRISNAIDDMDYGIRYHNLTVSGPGQVYNVPAIFQERYNIRKLGPHMGSKATIKQDMMSCFIMFMIKVINGWKMTNFNN